MGYLALVLHSHLPFVRNPGSEEILEERWLFETITNCYAPLLETFQRLSKENIKFRVTVSLSPSLLMMLKDAHLQEKYRQYLLRMIALGEKEVQKYPDERAFLILAQRYLERAKDLLQKWEQRQGDLTGDFKRLALEGKIELITTCATHGYLPLMSSDKVRQAQIEIGIQTFEEIFGFRPQGFWLPECGYIEGVEQFLQEQGIQYFLVDTHGLLGAKPAPKHGVYAPLDCGAGISAFARDPDSSRQVWERRLGYPGHSDYREFYRDVGFDESEEYLQGFLPQKVRVDTGYKYYRITGDGEHKAVYQAEIAQQRAAEHAAHFVQSRLQQFGEISSWMQDREPLVVAPYDAELFGHWWYEGPDWLENLFRLAAESPGIETITPGDYLQKYPKNQASHLPMSSWGEAGYSYVWLNPENDWIYRHQHRAERKMTEWAFLKAGASGWTRRALNQAGRELLLAQSSDWAFILKGKTTVQYATKQIKKYIGNFNVLAEQIEQEKFDPLLIEQLEQEEPVFANLQFESFAKPKKDLTIPTVKRVLMLSWEFPPRTIGGLARHVQDLSEAMAGLGIETHVITCPAEDAPSFSLEKGVQVHRVEAGYLKAEEFMAWLKQLNQGMIDLVEKLVQEEGLQFDILHAHDWLVREAAQSLSQKFNWPLVATIHATEYGRNRGLFTDLQKSISFLEGDLVAKADRIICCSQYMKREIQYLFGDLGTRLKFIPNGVNAADLVRPDKPNRYREQGDKNIVFLGRLVPEKGLQVLIGAMFFILQEFPQARILAAGRGPYEANLREQVEQMGLGDRVQFLGFVNEEGRNELLAGADLAVFPSLYEPFGIVALEAMAAGVPVVVSDTGGLGEIVEHGVDGYKFSSHNEKMLAKYAGHLLNNPELSRSMVQQAKRKILTKYNWQQIAYTTALVYAEAKQAKTH